jgi:hypothetical protein
MVYGIRLRRRHTLKRQAFLFKHVNDFMQYRFTKLAFIVEDLVRLFRAIDLVDYVTQ